MVIRRMKTTQQHPIIIAALAASLASSVFAGTTIPRPIMTFQIAGCPIDIDPWTCGDVRPLDDGFFLFEGRHEVEGLGKVDWSLRIDPDPFVIAVVTFSQHTGSTQAFGFGIELPYTTPGPTCMGGSIAASITDRGGDGATVAPTGGGRIYSARIDDKPVAGGDLPIDAAPIVAGPYGTATIGPAAFGRPIPGAPSGAVSTGIGIVLALTLTSDDALSITSIFAVEPGCEESNEADGGSEKEDGR